jgi:hypothetical protein
LVLATFLLYEHTKGEASYWYPYIILMPNVTFFCHWSDEEVKAVDCPALQMETDMYRTEVDIEWEEICKIMVQYP